MAETVAERLIRARRAAGLTQAELARLAGVSREVIAHMEVGRSKKPDAVKAIADALKISPAWLMFGDARIDTLSKDVLQAAMDLQKLPEDMRRALIAAIHAAGKP